MVANKADTLVPYMFSVAIENSKLEAYFTEKLLDCFLTGNPKLETLNPKP